MPLKLITKKKCVAVKIRAKNERTAKDWAIVILGKEKKGLPLKDLANRMLERGYKTTSTNFSVALYQVLHSARNKGETFDVCDNGELGVEEVRGGADVFCCGKSSFMNVVDYSDRSIRDGLRPSKAE